MSYSSSRQKPSGLPKLLVYSLLISFLLHILFFWVLPLYIPRSKPAQPTTTFVTLENLPLQPEPEQKPETKELELDESPLPDQPPPEQANRLAEKNQSVEQEMAPRGEDSRDQPAIAPTPEPSPGETVAESPIIDPTVKQPPPTVPKEPAPATKTQQQEPTITEIQPSKSATLPQEQPVEVQPSPPKGTPSLEQLTKLSPTTKSRISQKAQRERVKKRDDLLEGDAVYLNLQHDFLISFFQRFSNRIESVWNYPEEAARRGEQGVLLLKITVTREGELIDVELLESSHSDALDYEAIQAIYRAAPFGPVTKHWPHEQMKIYAHFQYTLSNKLIYGR